MAPARSLIARGSGRQQPQARPRILPHAKQHRACPSAKTTLKTEIMFALTPDFTNTRDKPPAHADARDFNGLLPANSGISSMPRIIPNAPGFAMKISA